MNEWLRAAPEILLVLSVLGLPGLLPALCLRFRRWDAVGLAVPLSLGVLALADELASKAHLHWGLPVIVVSTAVLAVICAACAWAVAHLPARLTRADSDPPADAPIGGAVWSARDRAIAAGVTVLAALVGAYLVAKGIGTPQTLNQTFDGAFHVNSINLIAHTRSAAPSVFGQLGGSAAGAGFYPPTFAAIASLLVTYAGSSPVVAANVTALAIALLWPFTVSIGIRRLARPSAFGYCVAMIGAVTVGLFPALLLRFGTLWPNALSYLALAPALVMVVRLFGLDQTGDDRDPHGRLPWWPTVAATVIGVPGLIFAHPGALFLVIYLSMPVLVWFGWRLLARRPLPSERARILGSAGVVVAVAVLFVVFVAVAYEIPAIASVRRQYWKPLVSWYHSGFQVLVLDSHLSWPNLAMGILAVIGIVIALRRARGRYLVACWLTIAGLTILAAGIETHFTMHWTGFWYNDPYRLYAALPVVVLPLVALGADELRARIAAAGQRLFTGERSWPGGPVSIGVAAGLVVCMGIVAFQAGLGTSNISRVVAASYGKARHKLVTPAEQAMLERLGREMPRGRAIAGDPFSGAILAGVLSGHPIVYATFGRPVLADRALVGRRFHEYRSDPAVCAAVKRLNIGVVVGGRHFFQESPQERSWFVGFNDLETTPGLTLIDRGGGVSAYRVGPCRA